MTQEIERDDAEAVEGEAVEVECDLADPPVKVWRALTEPEILAAWLMPNDMRAEPGHRFGFDGDRDIGGRIDCEVLEAEPHRLLRYSWRAEARDADGRRLDSVVTFTLSETDTGGTRLRVVHSGFPVSLHRPATRLAANSNAGPAVRLAA